MENGKMFCSVCGLEGAQGVYSSGIAPVSLAYCNSCMQKGAEPYDVLVTRVAHLTTRRPNHQLSTRLQKIIQVSLDVAGVSEERFLNHVRKRQGEMFPK